MAVTEKASGTQTATVTTEHTLTTQTDAEVYVLRVDVNAMVAGDALELRAKTRVLSAGTTRLEWRVALIGAQEELIVASIPIVSPHEVIFTLKQTTGTSRDFPWSACIV